jgi:hypothetical protein
LRLKTTEVILFDVAESSGGKERIFDLEIWRALVTITKLYVPEFENVCCLMV